MNDRNLYIRVGMMTEAMNAGTLYNGRRVTQADIDALLDGYDDIAVSMRQLCTTGNMEQGLTEKQRKQTALVSRLLAADLNPFNDEVRDEAGIPTIAAPPLMRDEVLRARVRAALA